MISTQRVQRAQQTTRAEVYSNDTVIGVVINAIYVSPLFVNFEDLYITFGAAVPHTLFSWYKYSYENNTIKDTCYLVYECVVLTSISVIIIWFYLLSFITAGQVLGKNEDMINKPGRPIASGVISVSDGRKYWMVYVFVYILLCVWIDPRSLLFPFGWILMGLIHNQMHGAKRWYIKNSSVATGWYIMVMYAWHIGHLEVSNIFKPSGFFLNTFDAPIKYHNLTKNIEWGNIICTIIFTITMSCQDFRDVKGDKLVGRVTLPLAIGETRARVVVCVANVLPTLSMVINTHKQYNIWILHFLCLDVIIWMFMVGCLCCKTRIWDQRAYITFLTLGICNVMCSFLMVE